MLTDCSLSQETTTSRSLRRNPSLDHVPIYSLINYAFYIGALMLTYSSTGQPGHFEEGLEAAGSTAVV
jgi:hypothetical protein